MRQFDTAPVSQMKSATGLTGNDKDGQDLYARAAKELGHEGSIESCLGVPALARLQPRSTLLSRGAF